MTDLNNHLIELSDQFDKIGKQACADEIDGLIESGSLTKVAQYVGVIGYVLKQNRAMCNCIRKKRVANSGSMQDVILQCLKEYQDGQDYQDNKWTSKYAQNVTQHPEKFNKAHLSLIKEMGQSDLPEHINEVRKVASVLKDNEMDDEVINNILSHVQTLGEMLQKEAANTRPFKVAADPANKSKWSRFWDASWNPLSTWRQENRARSDDQEMDRELDELTDKIMNISTLTDTMKDEILHLKAQARYIPDKEASKVISELNIDDWMQTQHDIDQLQRALGGSSTSPTRPVNDAIALSKELGKTRDTIKSDMGSIRSLLQSLARRDAVKARRKHRAAGQAESIAVEFGMLRRVVRQLGKNPLDERAHDYALHIVSRLSDTLDPVDPAGRFPVDTDEEVDNFAVHKQINDWIKQPSQIPAQTPTDTPVTESTVSTAVSPGNIDPGRISEIAESIRTKVGNPQEAANILHTIGMEMMGTNLIDRSLYDVLIQIRDQLKSPVGSSATPAASTPASTPLPEAASPKTQEPVARTQQEQFNLVPPSPEAVQELIRRRKEQNTAFRNSSLLKIADAIDEVEPELASVIDKYIEEHGDVVNLPKIPEFGIVLKE